MSRPLRPIRPQRLVRAFERDGWTRKHQVGSHLTLTKAGASRPVVIPMGKDVPVGIILKNMRTAGMSRSRLFELLDA